MSLSAVEVLSADGVRSVAASMGLLPTEVDAIVQGLGRLPGKTELVVFAGMWSEHCSYKSTKTMLATLPREGARVLAGPGSHAGAIDIGDGWAFAFKVESHNHPSAVEPFQGAATGVGGILRDVIAQGARPCAVMDSLCFGMPDSPRMRHLVDGVVAGIAGYGNAFGVPNVGGRTVYDPGYEGNPLVNALAAGFVRAGEMRLGVASGAGNAVVYVGATTGRDGILGAAFASEELGADNTARRTHVQVGDPFTGKKLMEACLSFTPEAGLCGCQDMGACGLSCGLFEMAAAGQVGMDIDLGAIPLREADMSGHEILLSESQERFLFVVRQGAEAQALAHFRRHGLHAAVCGRVTESGRVCARLHGEVVVDLPAALVAGGAPLIRWPQSAALPLPRPYPEFGAPTDLGATLLALLGQPGLCDPVGVYDHYDQTVGNRTVRGPGQAEAAVLKVPGTRRGVALTVTSRGDLLRADPYAGAQATVAAACRNLACVGAALVAVTDGINHGSPRDPVECRRLAEVIRGLGDALRALRVPVTGGNVSLYNESPHGAIPPTPMVGGVGLVDSLERLPTAALAPGHTLFLLGLWVGEPSASFYGGWRTKGAVGPVAQVDLAAETKLAALLVAEVERGHVAAAKDGGKGGLGVALAKMCARGGCGADLELPAVARRDWALFGERPASAWVSVPAAHAAAFRESAEHHGVPWVQAGVSGGDVLHIRDLLEVRVAALAAAFAGGGG
ncbi:MAG: phosphoribosylformylglycinamidine synthase subunit PurL [Deltaproteobacteria bacterium]|nr:phosphoribosylformylglycinamidine synthase subunit PurL [Deltaproteobacteria bacterium]